MVKLIFENERGDRHDLINSSNVRLEEVTGVGAVANIARQSIAGRDGAVIGDISRPERTISVMFRLRGSADGEQTMHDMYRLFEAGSSGTMTAVGRLGTSSISYVVQECDIPPNQPPPVRGTAILICPDPYFRGGGEEEQTIAGSYSTFMFPFTFPAEPFYISRRIESVFSTIENDGEAETDMQIEFYATSTVVNPALIDINSGKRAQLRFTMEMRDKIIIDTTKGAKSITLERNGERINIFNYMLHPFEFFSLKSGPNNFKYEADSGADALEIKIRYTAKFGAIYTNAPGAIVRPTDEELAAEVEEIARIVKRGGLAD